MTIEEEVYSLQVKLEVQAWEAYASGEYDLAEGLEARADECQEALDNNDRQKLFSLAQERKYLRALV